MFIGRLVGSFFSNYLPEVGINTVYAVLATVAVVMMFLPKSNDDGRTDMSTVTISAILALIVGVAAGIFGAPLGAKSW